MVRSSTQVHVSEPPPPPTLRLRYVRPSRCGGSHNTSGGPTEEMTLWRFQDEEGCHSPSSKNSSARIISGAIRVLISESHREIHAGRPIDLDRAQILSSQITHTVARNSEAMQRLATLETATTTPHHTARSWTLFCRCGRTTSTHWDERAAARHRQAPDPAGYPQPGRPPARPVDGQSPQTSAPRLRLAQEAPSPVGQQPPLGA